jgi:hypothetical protein
MEKEMEDLPVVSFVGKVQKHEQCLKDERFPVVFCVNCGSTYLDQNSMHELRCYDCGNTLAWDGTKFGVNRWAADPQAPDRLCDAIRAFKVAAR